MTGWTDHLLMAPIVVPMLAGAAMILAGERRRSLIGAIGLLSTLTLIVLAGVLLLLAQEPVVRIYRLGNWPTLFGIVLVLDRLSALEREVMRLIARGYTYKECAGELYISVKTVETHVSAVLRKLQLSNRNELTRWAAARRIV